MKEPGLKMLAYQIGPYYCWKKQLKELKKASKNGKESSAETLPHILTRSGEAEAFAAELGRRMREYNPEYREKRNSNRLRAPETALPGPESFERFKAARIDRGYHDGQFKLNLLMQDEKRHAMFKELGK